MKNVENGVVFGSKHVPDELIVRMSWLLPATHRAVIYGDSFAQWKF